SMPLIMLVPRANIHAARAPIIATANRPATRATALLMADAVPVSRSATDVMTAVETGPATKLIPMPNTAISGSTTNHTLWRPTMRARTGFVCKQLQRQHRVLAARFPEQEQGEDDEASDEVDPEASALAVDEGQRDQQQRHRRRRRAEDIEPPPGLRLVGRRL